MNIDTNDSPNGESKPQRGSSFTLAVVLAIACVFALFLTVDSALLTWLAMRLYVLIIAAAPGLVLALGCLGWGDTLMRSWVMHGTSLSEQLSIPERAILAFGCGAAYAFLMLLGTNTFISFSVISIGLLGCIPLARTILARLTEKSESAKLKPKPSGSVSVTSLIVGAVMAVAIALLAGMALTPPVLFDVTEYHLGSWTDYYHPPALRFTPMPHNFYARFPFPIEALYYLGLNFAPFHDGAPKVFNALCVIACAALASMFTRRLGGSPTAMMLAGLITLAHPVMQDVSIDAMIDAPMALLVASSVYAGFLTTGALGGVAMPRMMIVSALLFGSALAAKYTVAQIFLLPWTVLILWPMFRMNFRRPKLIIGAAVLAAVPCLFWFGKNVFFYGNPLEPFFVKWFRPDDAAGIAREKFYIESHFPQSPLTAEYWTSLLPRLREYQWVVLVACAGWIFRARNGAVARVLLFAAGGWLLWNLVRESQNRFLLPAMVLLAPVAVMGAKAFPTPALRNTVAGVLVLFAAANTARYGLTFHQSAVLDYILDFVPGTREDLTGENGEPTARGKFYETNLGDLGRVVNEVNHTLRVPDTKADAGLLLIYEARPYLFPGRSRYNVVWDDSELLNIIRPASTTEDAWKLLRRAGINHVLVNRQELLRYIQQYARPAQLRRLGVRAGEDPRAAWSATATPQDLYPPFYRDPDWPRLRPIVNEMLQKLDKAAIIRQGAPAPQPGLQPLDIYVAPVAEI